MKPVHHALAELQHRLQIHGDQARQILRGLPVKANRFDVQGILVRNIADRVFHASVGRCGRFSNNISNLKREVRPALNVEGEPLGYVDISCCQPALLLKELDSHLRPRSIREQETRTKGDINYDSGFQEPVNYDSGFENGELAFYRSLVQSGRLYEYLLETLCSRGINISRERLKKRFLTDTIAKKGQYFSPVEEIVRTLFPTVYGFIQDVNRQGQEHGNLIRQLQRAESDFVIGIVADDLVTRFPGVFFLTLHDAIFTTAEHLPKVEQAFHRGFEQIGFRMSLKTVQPNEPAWSPTTKKPMDPGTWATDAKRPRLRIRNSDQGRVTTMLRGPELVSSVIGLRWPRLEAA